MTDTNYHGIQARMQAILFLNGLCLFVVAILFGWVWFFHLLEEIVVWPLPIQIEVDIPGDSRAFRMGHMEAITQGLLLMALAFGGQFMRLSKRNFRCLCGQVLLLHGFSRCLLWLTLSLVRAAWPLVVDRSRQALLTM